MKRMTNGSMVVLALCAVLFALCARAADAVEGAQCSFTNNRGDSVSYVSSTEFYRGSTILFTNCMFQTTGTATQGLDGVTIEMRWGTAGSNNAYTGTAQVAASGTWWLSFTMPTNWEDPFIQMKLTDSNTNSYIYPWKKILSKAAL